MKNSEYFAPLYGNEALRGRLCALLDAGNVPHAVLIAGEDGCGRNLAATLLARALLGDETGLVTRGAHPDFVEITGEGASGMITVRRVREASYELNKSAVMTDGVRVCLLRDAGALNRSSANALLKMIEQPPDGVTFILSARAESELIETILSRCVRFRVQPLEPEECLRRASALWPNYEVSRLRALCGLYGGRFGALKTALGDPARLALSDCAGRLCEAAARGDKLGVLAALECAKTRAELKILLFELGFQIRRSLLEDTGLEPLLTRLEDAALEAAEGLERNANQKLLCARFAARL